VVWYRVVILCVLVVAVLFGEAILLGLTHETAYHNVHFTANRSFPFATVERTVSLYVIV